MKGLKRPPLQALADCRTGQRPRIREEVLSFAYRRHRAQISGATNSRPERKPGGAIKLAP